MNEITQKIIDSFKVYIILHFFFNFLNIYILILNMYA